MICEYGCGQEASFILKNSKHCCSKHYNSCPRVREKSSISLARAHKDPKRFGNRSRKGSANRELFVYQKIKDQKILFSDIGKFRRRGYLYWKFNYQCCGCGLSEWRERKLILEIEHIDGNHHNNEESNLMLLCPNCHSITPTFRNSKNRKSKSDISDEELLQAFIDTKVIHKALIQVNLATNGAGNQKRLLALIEKDAEARKIFLEENSRDTSSQFTRRAIY